jgi:hypothetical protein
MSTDMQVVLELVKSGALARDEVAAYLSIIRGASNGPLITSSLSPTSSSSSSLASFPSISYPQTFDIPERDHEEKPFPSASSHRPSASTQPIGFRQRTLLNCGHTARRTLPDGSEVLVQDAKGLPATSHPRGAFECKSCLRMFSNKGCLAVHIRFNHPTHEAALNRLHTKTTTTTKTSLNTRKRNTVNYFANI